MQITTAEALFTKMTLNEFTFEAQDNTHKIQNMQVFSDAIRLLPMVTTSIRSYYRARKIDTDKSLQDEGIKYNDGIPVCGFDGKHSGAPPEHCVKEPGRINRVHESVLYIAEDKDTAIAEQKMDSRWQDIYLSLAECNLKEEVTLADFSALSRTDVENKFSKEDAVLFSKKHVGINIYELYVGVQRYLTDKNFTGNGYCTPLAFIDMLKKSDTCSGVMYISSYTLKKNITLWDKAKFPKFNDGTVEKK